MHGSVCKLRESIQEVVYGSVCVVVRKIYRKFAHGSVCTLHGRGGGKSASISVYYIYRTWFVIFFFFYYSCIVVICLLKECVHGRMGYLLGLVC